MFKLNKKIIKKDFFCLLSFLKYSRHAAIEAIKFQLIQCKMRLPGEIQFYEYFLFFFFFKKKVFYMKELENFPRTPKTKMKIFL